MYQNFSDTAAVTLTEGRKDLCVSASSARGDQFLQQGVIMALRDPFRMESQHSVLVGATSPWQSTAHERPLPDFLSANAVQT